MRATVLVLLVLALVPPPFSATGTATRCQGSSCCCPKESCPCAAAPAVPQPERSTVAPLEQPSILALLPGTSTQVEALTGAQATTPPSPILSTTNRYISFCEFRC